MEYTIKIKSNISIEVSAESKEDAEMKVLEKPDMWNEELVRKAIISKPKEYK